MKQIEILQHQQAGRLIIWIERKKTPEIVERLLVHHLRMFNQLRQFHFTFSVLPVSHRCIEYLIHQVLHHLSHELFLHRIKA